MYKYLGGAFLLGVPSRDLTDEEAEKFGKKMLVNSGLYVRVGAPDAPKSKRSRSGQPVTETPEPAQEGE